MSERLAVDIARDLRIPGPWPSLELLTEAADKLEGLVELLANAERDRDEARAEIERLKANQPPAGGMWVVEYGNLAVIGDRSRRPEYTHQRRVWVGNPEPIPSGDDPA